jgi:hypothetical protein
MKYTDGTIYTSSFIKIGSEVVEGTQTQQGELIRLRLFFIFEIRKVG